MVFKIKELDDLRDEGECKVQDVVRNERNVYTMHKKLEEDLEEKKNQERIFIDQVRLLTDRTKKLKTDNDKLLNELQAEKDTVYRLKNPVTNLNKEREREMTAKHNEEELNEMIQENTKIKNENYEYKREFDLMNNKIDENSRDISKLQAIRDDLELKVNQHEKEKRDHLIEMDSMNDRLQYFVKRNGDDVKNLENEDLRIKEQNLIIRAKILEKELEDTRKNTKDYTNKMEEIYGGTNQRVEKENLDLKREKKLY